MKSSLKWLLIVVIGVPAVAIAGIFSWTFVNSFYHDYKGDFRAEDGKYYAPEDLAENIVNEPEEGVEIKRTPEETYMLFRDALLAGDVDGVLGYVEQNQIAAYRAEFSNPETLKLYQAIPPVEKIKDTELMSGLYRSYMYYMDGQIEGEDMPYTITFVLDDTGYFLIESI